MDNSEQEIDTGLRDKGTPQGTVPEHHHEGGMRSPLVFIIALLLMVIGFLTFLLLRKPSSSIPVEDTPVEEYVDNEIPGITGYDNDMFGFSFSYNESFDFKEFSSRQFAIVNTDQEVVLEGVVLQDSEDAVITFEEFVLDSARLLCGEQRESQSACMFIEEIRPLSTVGAQGETFYITGEWAGQDTRYGPFYAFNVSSRTPGMVSVLLLYHPFLSGEASDIEEQRLNSIVYSLTLE